MPRTSRRIAVLLAAVLVVGMQSTLGAVGAQAADPGTATAIAAGGDQGCAITPNQRLKCWGDNDYGQLGIGDDLSDQFSPVLVPGLKNVKKVDVGDYNTCAILKGGKLKCWGYNSDGEVGDGTTTDRHLPTQVKGLTSDVKQVSVGTYHVCAVLTNGKAKCWGYNYDGEIGDGTTTQREKPTKVIGLDNVKSISAGYYFTCATLTNGKAKCWGNNDYGQLGNGSIDEVWVPTQVKGLTSGVKKTVAGYYQSCAIVGGGKLKCWGYNYYGEIGTGSTGGQYKKPQNVIGLESGVTDVDADYYFTCAVKNHKAKCWGYNYYNELGNGDTTDRDVATQVTGLTKNVTKVDTGWYHACALLKSGAEKCWGWNGEGEVGINDTVNDQIPTPKRVLL